MTAEKLREEEILKPEDTELAKQLKSEEHNPEPEVKGIKEVERVYYERAQEINKAIEDASELMEEPFKVVLERAAWKKSLQKENPEAKVKFTQEEEFALDQQEKIEEAGRVRLKASAELKAKK